MATLGASKHLQYRPGLANNNAIGCLKAEERKVSNVTPNDGFDRPINPGLTRLGRLNLELWLWGVGLGCGSFLIGRVAVLLQSRGMVAWDWIWMVIQAVLLFWVITAFFAALGGVLVVAGAISNWLKRRKRRRHLRS